MTSHCAPPTITFVSSHYKYHVKYDGKTIETIVTDQSAVAEEWVNEILLIHSQNLKVVVGIDTRYIDSIFRRHPSKCFTLQVCTDAKCLILQLSYMNEIPRSIKDFFMNPRFTFMGVDEDISKLVSEYGLDFAKSEDIRAATISKYPRRFQRHDLYYIAEQLTGLKFTTPSSGSLGEWGNRVLDEEQVLYACIVAYASYKATLFRAKNRSRLIWTMSKA